MKLHWQILVALGLGAKRNWHIFIALVLGIVFGGLTFVKHPFLLETFDIVGQVFIRAIQMVVIPLVVSAIIVGIASLGDSKQIGKIGGKMVFYYLLITLSAVLIGLGLSTAFHPGDGANSYINQQQAVIVQQQVESTLQHQQSNLTDMYLGMIPKNPIESLAKGEMVPIIIFVLIFGAALGAIGEINRPVVSFFESVFAATMKVTDWIMIFAPLGIFALTFTAVSQFGVSIFSDIGVYLGVIIFGLFVQLLITYPIILKLFSKVKFTSLYKAVAEAMMVAFGTASSSATLPVTIACCERRAGISNKICSFVLPLGATMSMDGTAMVQVIAVMFLTQAYGVALDPFTILQVCLLAMIASSTSAGIPGAGLITIALVLNGLGLTPDQLIQGFTLLFAIDRITDMLRTMVNVTSDTVVAAVIADNEGELDYELLGNQEVWKEVV